VDRVLNVLVNMVVTLSPAERRLLAFGQRQRVKATLSRKLLPGENLEGEMTAGAGHMS
jgi:hypothetical protein